VAMPTFTAAATSASLRPSSALRRMRARAVRRALGRPERRSCCSDARSSAVRFTTYLTFLDFRLRSAMASSTGERYPVTRKPDATPITTSMTDV
jgi:hypothetical protein